MSDFNADVRLQSRLTINVSVFINGKHDFHRLLPGVEVGQTESFPDHVYLL